MSRRGAHLPLASVVLLALAVVAAATPAAAQEASPSPTATPHADCGPLVVNDDGTLNVGTPLPTAPAWGMDGRGGRTVRVRGLEPGEPMTAYAYERPSTTYRQVGVATTDDTSTATFTFAFQGNARVYFFGGGCVFSSPQYVAPTAARLGGLMAHRGGPRAYTFSAFYAGPDGKIGSLYRVTSDGREVLTSQTRLGGEWPMIRRVFTGTGRFGFVLRAGDDISSGGAATNVRDTVIH